MGGGSKSSNQTTTIQLPAWVEQASQSNYNFAKDIANRPYNPYEGNRIADFSPDQYGAFDYARQNTGAYQGAFDDALGMASYAGNSQTPFVNGAYNYERIDAPTTTANYSFERVNGPSVGTDFSRYAGQPIDYNQERVNAQSFKDADVSSYMNPYLGEVESYALQNLQAGTQQGLNKIGDQAASAGAFGGSRQGVQEGVLMGDSAKRAGELSAGIRQQGYDRALQQITADQNRALQANMANQNANMQGQIANRDTRMQLAGMDQRGQLANQSTQLQAALANQTAGMQLNQLDQNNQFANQKALMQAALANQTAGMDLNKLDLEAQMANQNSTQKDLARQLQAALGMGDLATSANANVGTDIARLLSIGGMQQDQEQRYLTDDEARFNDAQNYPLEQLNILLSALGMSPYGKTQTTNTTTSGGGMDFGGLLGGAGTFAAGAAKLLPFLIGGSDKKLKTDIEEVGTDKKTGLPVYAYRYKGDPKSYPKVLGLMADDIEKDMPDQVVKVGGKKGVKFDPRVEKSQIILKKKKAKA